MAIMSVSVSVTSAVVHVFFLLSLAAVTLANDNDMSSFVPPKTPPRDLINDYTRGEMILPLCYWLLAIFMQEKPDCVLHLHIHPEHFTYPCTYTRANV